MSYAAGGWVDGGRKERVSSRKDVFLCVPSVAEMRVQKRPSVGVFWGKRATRI